MSTSSVLFDTNVLVYNQDKDSSYYKDAYFYHKKVFKGEFQGVIAVQNFLEFSAVITSPFHVIRPLSVKSATLEIEKYQSNDTFHIIYPNDSTISVFLDLLRKYKVRNSKHVFDVFLVATMLSNHIDTILTANVKDFVFNEIKTIKLTSNK